MSDVHISVPFQAANWSALKILTQLYHFDLNLSYTLVIKCSITYHFEYICGTPAKLAASEKRYTVLYVVSAGRCDYFLFSCQEKT